MVELFMKNKVQDVKFFTFPAGERSCKIESEDVLVGCANSCTVTILYKSSDDLIDTLLLCNALRQINPSIVIYGYIPYFPYARQDRVCDKGEAFSLQVACGIIELCNFKSVKVDDAHSNVLSAFFDAGTLVNNSQASCLSGLFDPKDAVLVSPDNGASKKVYELAKLLNLPVIEAGKVRCTKTGNIIKTTLTQIPDSDIIQSCSRLVVVDDICDGGRTFIELAKELKQFYKPLELVVTHGIFSKGLSELETYYSKITCKNKLY